MKPYQRKTIGFYDKYVDTYIAKTKKLRDTSWLEKFVMLLPKNPKVLDAGCAYGRDCEYFAQYGITIWGVDLSREMIKKAQEQIKNGVFKVMDILDLKFPNAFFDGVWCSAVLLHLKKTDVPKAIEEMKRVLKEKGTLYINVKKGEGEENVKDHRYGQAEKFYSYFTESELCALLEKEGFAIVESKTEHYKDAYRLTGIIYIIARKK